jgi:hypothetical protein
LRSRNKTLSLVAQDMELKNKKPNKIVWHTVLSVYKRREMDLFF